MYLKSQGLPFKNFQQIIRFHWLIFHQKKTKSPRESWRSLEGSNPHLHRQLWSASDTRQRVDSHWVSCEHFRRCSCPQGPGEILRRQGDLEFFSDVSQWVYFQNKGFVWEKSWQHPKFRSVSSRMFGQNRFGKRKNAVQRSQLEQVSPIQCSPLAAFRLAKAG